ncbi:hypothetical protein [Paenibacillus lautus]|uniref:hypothetical protein n=1 Tax=Paenibacillus lautus TaxID=1401 RepID=UPI002DB777EF|nr:hypothetical protein [Paenibacillus lautus]MEC0256180.1 hypothetical protein [Paenibacillus lautus]
MSDKQKRFKYIMVIIAVVGVLGTVIPNLLDTSYEAAEKAVICLSFLIGVPLVVSIVYWIGKKILKG